MQPPCILSRPWHVTLQAVTKAKLGYNPMKVDSEDMMSFSIVRKS